MENPEKATRFVELLTSHQRDLYAYINTLLVGDSGAADVLQDTNLDLWSRLDNYDFDRPFLPWAFAFAFHRVMAFRKSQVRSRLVFTDEVVHLISDGYMGDSKSADARLAALQGCLDKLEPNHSRLIRDRYMMKMSIKALASRLESTTNQISARLYRIRKSLAKCVEMALVTEMR